MQRWYQLAAGLLLAFNGIGALYGGLSLVMWPDGSALGLPLSLLEHTAFRDFFWPGFILLFANGFFSLFVWYWMVAERKYYPWLVMAQGDVLLGWIIIQVWLIRSISGLHYMLGGIGLALSILGVLMLVEVGRKHENG